jgi:subtilisin-like proprotein convertase family protein
MGTMSFNGTSGPCTANQNCPTTSFTTVVAGAPGPVAGVRLSLEAVAASTDQNTLTLKSPAGTSVLLFNQRGTFLTDDFVGTLFDDDATAPVATAPGPFHGCFRPEQPLSAFDGQSADGTWTLEVKTCLYETSVTSWTLHLDF